MNSQSRPHMEKRYIFVYAAMIYPWNIAFELRKTNTRKWVEVNAELLPERRHKGIRQREHHGERRKFNYKK